MEKFQLFHDDEDNFQYPSPSKDPLNIANPEYKPFGRDYSSSYSQNSGAKSEDDSPLRRKIIKSPRKKRVKILSEKEHKEKMEYMQRLLNESDLLDNRLK